MHLFFFKGKWSKIIEMLNKMLNKRNIGKEFYIGIIVKSSEQSLRKIYFPCAKSGSEGKEE